MKRYLLIEYDTEDVLPYSEGDGQRVDFLDYLTNEFDAYDVRARLDDFESATGLYYVIKRKMTAELEALHRNVEKRRPK
jgi:hypothetical protein